MIVLCATCRRRFEDQYRSTVCPHPAFPANDCFNNFTVHNDAFLDEHPVRRGRRDIDPRSERSTQPWLSAGISRRSWYRRKAKARAAAVRDDASVTNAAESQP
jgi:hypothetical protein